MEPILCRRPVRDSRQARRRPGPVTTICAGELWAAPVTRSTARSHGSRAGLDPFGMAWLTGTEPGQEWAF